MRTRGFMAVALACVAVFLGTQSSPAASSRGLHVSGNRIVNAAGHTVVLDGVNRAGTEGGPDSSSDPVTDAEIGWLGKDHPGSWDAQAVRVAVGEAQWTGACPKLSGNAAGYRAYIDAEVRSITKRGMIALIDLHTSTAGCTSIARHAMPDGPVAVTFWQSAAHHYGPNALVAFELYNEPHFVTQAIWRNGQKLFQDCDPDAAPLALRTCQATAPRYTAVGMQALYDVVHKAAPGHLIVVDGWGYATQPPTGLLTGPAVYAVHPYTCPGPGSCQSSTYDHANVDVLNRWVPLSKVAPIWVTELGWPTRTGYGTEVNGAAYYQQTLAWLQKRQPAWGWLAFAFDGSSRGAFTLTDDTTTYAPNATGQPVWNALHRGKS